MYIMLLKTKLVAMHHERMGLAKYANYDVYLTKKTMFKAFCETMVLPQYLLSPLLIVDKHLHCLLR